MSLIKLPRALLENRRIKIEYPTHTLPTSLLAGGYVRRGMIGQPQDSDIDLFFKTEEDFKAQEAHLKASGFTLHKENKSTKTYIKDGQEYQLIFGRYYSTYEELLDTFDYTICQCAMLSSGKVLCTLEFLLDAYRKRLAVHKITYPVASCRRMLKYARQGFTVCDGTITQLLLSATPENVNTDSVRYID